MNRDDLNLLNDLDAQAQLADLRIERTKLKDIPKLNIADMTAGELITLANVYEAIHILTNAFAGNDPLPSPRVETRAGGTFADMDVTTVNGMMKYGDVPRDANGDVSEEWLVENCVCDHHEQMRIERDRANTPVAPARDVAAADDSIARGLYL